MFGNRLGRIPCSIICRESFNNQGSYTSFKAIKLGEYALTYGDPAMRIDMNDIDNHLFW